MTEQELIDFIVADKNLENNTMEIMFHSDFRKRKFKHRLRGISFNERCVAVFEDKTTQSIPIHKYPKFIDRKDWTSFLYIKKWTLEELYEKINGVERTMKTVKNDEGCIRSRHTYSYKGKYCSILK